MLNNFKSRISVRFFSILTLVIILSVVPFTFITLQAIHKYGLEVAEINELRIRSLAFSYLKEITWERADRYQGFFDRIAASAGLLSRQASTIYSDLTYYAASPLENYQFHVLPQNGIWGNSVKDPVISLYWGAPEMGPDIKRELLALTHITPLLKQTLIENPEVLASHLISVSGIGQYCTDDPESKESVFNLPPASEFDLRNGEPMTIFTESRNTSRDVRWTDIYKDDVIDGLMLTASAPVYDSSSIFRGIVGIDVPLGNLINDILHRDDSRRGEKNVLFSFLLDQNGGAIAVPGSYYPLFGLTVDSSALNNSGDRLDIGLADSSKKDVRDLAHNLEGQEEHFSKIYHENESYLVFTHRMTKLGWILGVVVRENDMFYSILESRLALENTIKHIKLKAIILSLLTVCVAIVAVFIAVRHLVLPLRTLIDAANGVAGGDLSTRCRVTTGDEVGLLAVSFNSMVKQLQDAQIKQQNYSKSLESEVESRDTELVLKKDQLGMTIGLLEKEVERRQIIGNALENSQKRYFDTLEASVAGIFIIDRGIFTYINTSFTDMVQYSKEELIGLRPLDIIIDDDIPLVEENGRRRLAGETVLPYTVKWIRKDGSTFYGEVWAMINTWQNKPIMVATITDVTDIKNKEKQLKVQDKQLQESLDEKEVLLKEIYHRTKNNMLMIISLLDLQSQDIRDERVKTIFLETESRIRAMAMVHEKLYQSKNLSEIDLGIYLYDVARSLLASMVVDDRIKLVSKAESILINIDYAVPLGLVINEIVTNAIKHAFPANRLGKISIDLKKGREGEIILFVGDDGIGLPEDIDVHKATSFGMQIIIKSLVKLQLKGTVTVDRDFGTSYRISFPEPRTAKRI